MNQVYGYQVIGPVYQALNVLGGGGGATVSGFDHGQLGQLLDDDHTQYLLTNGGRQLTGDWDFGSFTISGTGDIYCDNLHTSSGSLYIGELHLTYNGSHLIVPAELDVTGDIGNTGDFYMHYGKAIKFGGYGKIGVDAMEDLLEIDQDKVTINGDFIFDNNTISGTGDIYCGDLRTSGTSIYLGALQLSYDGSKISIPSPIDTGQSVVLGGSAGGSISDDYNVSLGYRAGDGLQSGGSRNICVGADSGRGITSEDHNICIGSWTGETGPSSYNIFIGPSAGRYSTGQGNVFIGFMAGVSNTGNGNVFIGQRAGYQETGSNKLYIETTSTTSPLIYGEFDNDLVRINGDLDINGDSEVGDMNAYYLGDATTSGTWRIIRNGDDLKFQWYDGGSWNDGNVTVNRS